MDTLRNAVREVRRRSPFHIDAWVVLPDHMHCLWTLPEGDSDFPSRCRQIKTTFSKSFPVTEQRSAVMVCRGERGIWQRRYWEHLIRDDRDYAGHMDYVRFNPVKHGLTARAADWPYSSFQRCVISGLYRPSGSAAVPNRPRRENARDRRGGMPCAFPPYTPFCVGK
jgi:putative transposase